MWKVYDLGGGQIVALPILTRWPKGYEQSRPPFATWEGKAFDGADAIDQAAVYCFLHEFPWSGTTSPRIRWRLR
jgi:hypothetical protein